MEREELPPAIRKLLAAALTAGGIACAGAWSTPGAPAGTPAPAQPTGTAAAPAGTRPPAQVAPAEAHPSPETDDSLRAVAERLRADSLRADSIRADSARRRPPSR